MSRISILALSIFLYSTSFAQNLVVNGSFEEVEGKIKGPGQVGLAKPWTSGTKAQPDLYSEDARDEQVDVPENAYGDEKPKDGENYAGILIYSDREKEPRSYLFQQLKHPMLAGEMYCVKFHISFADISKYASNNIAAYISSDSTPSDVDLILNHKPQIINSTNRIFEQQWDWEDICRIYVAKGGEQYITIGNFAPQLETKTKAVKRPRGYTSSQTRDGYYFIDDISITPNATRNNCKCEPGNFQFAHLEKQETTFTTDESEIPDQVIISTTGEVHGEMPVEKKAHEDVIISFSKIKSTLAAGETSKMDEVVTKLKENPDLKIELVGHVDNTEKVVTGLSKKRIDSVNKYLTSKGIAANRITAKDVAEKEPLSPGDQPANSVVEIKFSK